MYGPACVSVALRVQKRASHPLDLELWMWVLQVIMWVLGTLGI